MKEYLSQFLALLNPFTKPPEKLPVISVGQGRRVVRYLVKPANYKGMVMVQTLPDLADGGVPVQLCVAPGRLLVIGWHHTNPPTKLINPQINVVDGPVLDGELVLSGGAK